MPAERYFISNSFEDGLNLFVEEQEFHHLIHVMRTKTGESVELVNGKGQLATAIVNSIEKKRAWLEVQSVVTQPLPQKRIILAQAIPRLNRLEFILEKGTELGMTEIWLFPAAHSEKNNFTDNQLQRLTTITIAAMKQCGRLFLPKIVLMPMIKHWKGITCPSFFGDTDPQAIVFSKAWQDNSDISEVLFCIGPESGFTDEEVEILKKIGFIGVKLNDNILRTDTAAITALAIIGCIT